MSDVVPPPASPAAPDEAVVDLLGLVAYGELTAFTELAADAAAAPSLRERVAMARLAGRELAHHELVVERLESLGVDPGTAMDPFVRPLDVYTERTRCGTWPERLVKAYVGDGIRTDFYREVSAHTDAGTVLLVDDVCEAQEDRTAVLVAGVRDAVAHDPAIEGRLALWGRRLMGEALSQAQRVAAERAALRSLVVGGVSGHGADLAELGRIMTRMSENHTHRMERLGLAP